MDAGGRGLAGQRLLNRGASRPSAPGRVAVWLKAVRVFSFTASVVPILVGSAVASYHGAVSLPLSLAMLLASVACHAGCNLANDYHDHQRGTDTAESLGPSGVIQSGLLSAERVRTGMLVAFGTASALGLSIVAATGWQILVLALACLAAAYFYTGGPRPLAYIALGEVTVFLAMGPAMVVGSAYVLTGRVTTVALLASLPVGLLVAAILHANNVRDMDLDRAAGKVTVATWRGRGFANAEFAALVGLAYPTTLSLVVVDRGLWPALLPLATGPFAVGLIRSLVGATTPQGLNKALRETARLHFRFGLLLAVGLLLATAIGELG